MADDKTERAEGAPASKGAARGRIARQAYVLIHGMGEQRPMDTVKGFARTIWSLDPDVQVPKMPHAEQMWSRPDNRTGSLELRRITTRKSRASDSFPKGVRTDFYELYWADLTAGSTWAQFTAWVQYLLVRPWSKVPADVRTAWLCLWIGALIVTALGLVSLIPDEIWKAHAPSWLSKAIVAALAAAILAFMHRKATASFGRVVKYTRSDPDNIAARKAVRERGLALLRELHAGNGQETNYDRVVLVGHSLGTILAHDLVSYFWAEQIGVQVFSAASAKGQAIASLEAAVAEIKLAPSMENIAVFREAQGRLGRILREASNVAEIRSRWLISDLVTVGSPLTHAEFLLADGPDDLKARCRARELPTCPPFREELDPQVAEAARRAGLLPDGQTRLMSHRISETPEAWALHFAAPFASVRWTNVFDPARRVAQGDMISGPLRKNFGMGILDLNISDGDRPSREFTHTRYWDADKTAAARLKTLRRAINLLDRN
ncbi:hypothetical protein SAMN02990966_07460 [Rhodospirillales bacterium URHD0017]|nr:hypothetical protein SAMN02990966_07460 [Rhodospirillales bacterium URHD0017]